MHIFYAISSFAHHFIAICELKFDLHYGNTQFRSKSTIILDVETWNWTDDLEKHKGTSPNLLQSLSFTS